MEEKQEAGGLGPSKLDELEGKLRNQIVSETRYMISRLTENIKEEDAPRALRLIESIAKRQRELISSIAQHGFETSDQNYSGFSNFEVNPSLTSQSETYGAQAMEGVLSALKPKPKPTQEILDLTSALVEANKVGPNSLIDGIRKKLNKLLEEEKPEESNEEPKENNG